MNVDVVIIGAGISGAITAQALAASGFRVVMLDRRTPLSGSTTATTALLQHEIDTPMLKLAPQIGLQPASRAWQRSKLALDTLLAKVTSLSITCEIGRRPSLYLAGNILNAKQLRKESELRRSAGLYNEYLERSELKANYGIDRSAALISFDNLTANPLQLAAGFLLDAQKRGAAIYSPVTVETVESQGKWATVRTDKGFQIRARFVIYAAGYELPKAVNKLKHKIHSTWAIATKPQRENLWRDEALIWEASDPYLYVRSLPDGRILCGGEDENFQDEEKRDALLPRKTSKLEKKLKALLPNIDPKADLAWCGSFGSTPTGLPTIGRVNGKRNVLAILAFGGNGITFSSLAAELVTSQLLGKTDLDRDLFSF